MKNSILGGILGKLFFLISLSLGLMAHADCSKEEAIKAEAGAAQLKDWHEVYEAFKNYSHCDDGAIAEGYSESVSQLLANNWDQLAFLEAAIKKDKKFEGFVLKHIDQTIAKENNEKIIENASKKCSKKSKDICKKITSVAKKNKF